MKSKSGITLIELLIALSISAILVGVIAFTLMTTLDTYRYVQDEVFLQKALDDTLQTIAEGDFENYGIKDSLEVLRAGSQSITFVPFWIDESPTAKDTKEGLRQYILSRPFKAGAGLPIGQVLKKNIEGPKWKNHSVALLLKEERNITKAEDIIFFTDPVPKGAQVRFLYHPDTRFFPDTEMTIGLSGNRGIRHYKNRNDTIGRNFSDRINIKDLKFQYYDNANSEILPDPTSGFVPKELIQNITAMKLSLEATDGQSSLIGSTFINLRNSRALGLGLFISPGLEVVIPDSDNIRTFSLVNIVGIKENGEIGLEAVSEEGQSWRVRLLLGTKNGKEVIKRFKVESPTGRTVFSEVINQTTDLPMNFLTIGYNGRYDYDSDEGVQDVVSLKGRVRLRVTQMDAAGAALFIRP